ncbi:10 TM acyl transferase domain found in Cas1p-domain-containing protein [Thelonectria olida]|uniref:10 TM acyl transferase domain found in Cas1p-domain-containing protein n=1 Tax=Thelonectria olida TaxID=1576542 RepID=A0A9P8W0V0_9HYPO|nr:10 TM acyl transferase domain found in Cas1p-domain-containing protein [Thelonectria olida]
MLHSSPTLALIGRILPLSFAICLLLAGILHSISGNGDPYRCGALLKNGSWLHEPNAKGARKPFTNWQPDGCMLRQYTPADIKDCIGDRHVVFSGDSTTRQVFWGMARLLDRKSAEGAHDHAKIHDSYNMTFGGVRMLQIWNPLFESGELNPNLTEELKLFSKEKHHPVPIEKQKGAAMIMLGAGSWYVLLEKAPKSLTKFQTAMNNITDLLHLQDLPKFGTTPMDPVDGVGNEIFIAPVAVPFYKDLPKDRTGPKGIHKGEVEDIDKWLAKIDPERNLRMLDSFPALSRGQPEAMVDRSQTGFHVIDSVAEVKATILLNARCNAKLDQLRGYAYNRTCCTDYGRPSFVQTLIVGLTTLYVLACAVFEALDIMSGSESPRRPLLNMKVGIFPTSLLFCYFADRTQIFAKGNKELVNSEFIVLTVICVIIAILTIRRTQFRSRTPAPPATAAPAKEDAGIMSRDQTEEWKGWMQAVILIYHWTGASKHLGIYMFVRLLVAAYLFQTGYGHTIYFLAKKDFSFRRIASVLLRLNILSCALPYMMNTDYMFYYFAPLVSFWFFVVYFTLAIGSKFNDNTNAVLSKINIALVLVWVIFRMTPVNTWIFGILQYVFRINWSLYEWEFRVQLDGVIVFVGMIAGVIQQRVERNSSWFTNYKTGIVPSIIALVAYTYSCQYHFEKKEVYTVFHPYISFIPILAFIILRNAFTPLRNVYSTASAWLGRCSLETFILQYHIYLAADTRGILLLDMFRGGDGSLLGDRWRDLFVIVPLFIWLSHCVSESSGLIVKLLTAKPKETPYDAEDEELKIEEPSYGILHNSHVTHISRAARGLGSDLRIKVVAMLLGMWLLNLFY